MFDLTHSEWTIVSVVCNGNMGIDQAAEHLGWTPGSAYVIIHRAYCKLGIHGLNELREWFDEQFPDHYPEDE